MTYIDTHTHLYLDKFDTDRKEMIQRAIDNGVAHIFLPNIDKGSFQKMEKMVADFPGICYAMIGVHPCDIVKDWKNQLTEIQNLYQKGHHIAIGEIGIDLYWDKTLRTEQMNAFRTQLQWAKQEQLPVSIHCRDAWDEILSILEEENNENLSGILHCFTGDIKQAERIIALGNFKLGIGGVVTFKNSGLDKTLQNIPLKHLVLETDAPFLAPSPHRGKRNESSYIPLIAQKLSSIYGIDEEKIGTITTENALTIFKIVRNNG